MPPTAIPTAASGSTNSYASEATGKSQARRGETPLDRALNARAPARLTRSLTDYSDTSMADLLRSLAASE